MSYEQPWQPVVPGQVRTQADFVRSVYLWLMGGFAVAGVGAFGALLSLPLLAGMNLGRGFMLILCFAQLGAIVFARAVSRRRPLNMIAYGLFTLVSGYIAGILSLAYAAQTGFMTVVMAAGLTAGAFLTLTITAFVSKSDFSFLRSFIILGIGVAFFGCLAFIIASFFMPPGSLQVVSLVLSGVIVLAYSAKLLYDTATMLRTSDYGDAAGFALSLFISLYQIFISLLNILGGSRRR